MNHHHTPQRPDDSRGQALAELRAINDKLGAIYELLDQFISVFLNAKFPYGKPTDQWERRPRG
jgi:hypothetical protein